MVPDNQVRLKNKPRLSGFPEAPAQRKRLPVDVSEWTSLFLKLLKDVNRWKLSLFSDAIPKIDSKSRIAGPQSMACLLVQRR